MVCALRYCHLAPLTKISGLGTHFERPRPGRTQQDVARRSTRDVAKGPFHLQM